MKSPQNFGGDGVSAFAHDPRGSFCEQTIFWAPEVLPTVIPVTATSSLVHGEAPQPPLDLAAAQVRRASDGWHATPRIGVAEHRVWLKEPPAIGATYVAKLPLDGDFDARAYAARRLWRAMNGRTPGPSFHELSKQRCERLGAAIRALDPRAAGRTYRAIAEAIFGKKRIPDRALKTHDLRNRTVRLVQRGLALMRGGYLQLLRSGRKDK